MFRRIQIILLSLIIFLSGCAKYITDKTVTDATGQEVTATEDRIEVTFTFDGPPAISSDQKYYLIFSPTDNIQTITPTHLPEAYLFIPGDSPDEQRMRDALLGGDDEKDLQDVYDDYFSTWERIYKYDISKQINEYLGFFTSTANHYTPTQLSYGSSGGTYEIKFYIIKPYDTFYLTFLAVGEDDVLEDHIDQVIGLDFEDGTVYEDTDNDDAGVEDGLDLRSYKVRMYTL